MKRTPWIPTYCLFAIASASCAAEVGEAPEVELAQEPLAVIEVDGAQVQFLEQRRGSPFVIAYSVPGQNPLADPALADLTIVELYERLAGESAPLALHEALEREYEAAAELAVPEGEELELDTEPEASEWVEKALTDTQFRATYCGLVQICHTDVTGTGEYNRYTRAVRGWVNPWQGDVSLQVRVKFITGWQNVAVAEVPQDVEAYYWTSYAINREQKVKVHNADGDFYHWAHGW